MEKIRKSELNKLLRSYGMTLGVFTQSQDDPCEYHGDTCYLRVEPDQEDPGYYIKVSLSDSTGKRLCTDIWLRDEKSPVLLKRLKDMVAEDREIQAKNRHIDKLVCANRQAVEELRERTEEISRLKEEVEFKDEEIYQLRKKLEMMEDFIRSRLPEEKCQKLSKNVGRPKETERINKKVQEISGLIRKDLSDRQIMEQLSISKPTYYRYKRRLNSLLCISDQIPDFREAAGNGEQQSAYSPADS